MQRTCDNHIKVIGQYCPHASAMPLEYGTAIPLSYIPYPGCAIPAAADYIIALGTDIQSADVMGMAKQESFCILFGRFAGLPRFYYSVLAT